jgi:predicted CopG family antitoxin
MSTRSLPTEESKAKGGRKKKRRRTLSVNERTYNELQKLGQYGDSVGDIIDRCIESHHKILVGEEKIERSHHCGQDNEQEGIVIGTHKYE